MTQLEELGLENCLLSGNEIEQLAIAMQDSPFLGKLKKLNINANKLDSEASVQEVAKLVAHAPRCEEVQSKGTFYAITSNHQVKVRRTDKDNHVIEANPLITMDRVFD